MKQTIGEINVAAKNFVEVSSNVKLSKPVYDNGWDARHIIAHIVSYHEYYASVITALCKKEPLPLIDESLAKVNITSANTYSHYSRKELIARFKKAHSLLTRDVKKLSENASIPYKKNGRIYQPNEYITEIARHITKHTKDLKRNTRKGPQD